MIVSVECPQFWLGWGESVILGRQLNGTCSTLTGSVLYKRSTSAFKIELLTFSAIDCSSTWFNLRLLRSSSWTFYHLITLTLTANYASHSNLLSMLILNPKPLLFSRLTFVRVRTLPPHYSTAVCVRPYYWIFNRLIFARAHTIPGIYNERLWVKSAHTH